MQTDLGHLGFHATQRLDEFLAFEEPREAWASLAGRKTGVPQRELSPWQHENWSLATEQRYGQRPLADYSSVREARAEERRKQRLSSDGRKSSQEDKLQELNDIMEKNKAGPSSLMFDQRWTDKDLQGKFKDDLQGQHSLKNSTCSTLSEEEDLIREYDNALVKAQQHFALVGAREGSKESNREMEDADGTDSDASYTCYAYKSGARSTGTNQNNERQIDTSSVDDAHMDSLVAQPTSSPDQESYEEDGESEIDMNERRYMSEPDDDENCAEVCEDFDTCEESSDIDESNDLEGPPIRAMQTMSDVCFASLEEEFERYRSLEDVDEAFLREDSPKETNPLELTYRSNITCWDDEAFKADANPEDVGAMHSTDEASRPSTAQSVFERLHAEHADKLRKSDIKRQERVLKLEEEWRELQSKCAKKIRSAPPPDEDPVWEKLFANASTQQQKRVEEMERRDSAQQKYLARNSVHRNVDKVRGGSLFNRLHEAHQQKLHALAQKRQEQQQQLVEQKKPKGSSAFTAKVGQRLHKESAAREERLQRLRDARIQEFGAKSVHGKVSPNSGAPRTDRLYKEAERRRQEQLKQERKRQEDEQAKLAAQPKKTAQGKARSDRLYKDATRRIQVQREAQQRREEEERERLQQQSIHFELVQRRRSEGPQKLATDVVMQKHRPKKNILGGAKRNTAEKQFVVDDTLERSPNPTTDDITSQPLISPEWSAPCEENLEFPRFSDDGNFGLLEILQSGTDSVEWQRSLAKLDPENMCQFIEALQTSQLQKLVLHGMGLHCHEVKLLVEAIREHNTLQHIDLSGNDFGIEGSYAIAKTLEENNVIQRLVMRGNRLCTDAVMAIAQSLKANSGLRSIDLSMNSLGTHEVAMLADVIKENKVLQELHINDNEIQDKGAVVLADALTCNDVLLILSLSCNSIRSEGGHAIAEALKRNGALQRLVLSGNELGVEGGKAIGDGIEFNTGLRYLDLAGNMIQVEGCLAVAGALKHNTSLWHLDLSFNCIQSEGAQALCSSLVLNSTLEHLDVAWNLIGNVGARCFANALEENGSLQRLSLVGNHLEETAGEALLGSLQANNSIECLELDGNDICPADARSIEELLRVNRRLCEASSPFLESILDEFF